MFQTICFKQYVSKKYLGIVVVLLAPLVFLYPIYDVELLVGNMFVSVSPYLSYESFEDKIHAQNVLFYKESLYQNVMVTEFSSKKALRLDGKV